MAQERPPKVFCSYRSADADAVEDFAGRLRASGVDAWFDKWEIQPGDDIVAKMDAGVDGCTAALIFVSSAWFDGKWAYDEYTSLALRAVEDGVRLIPVMLEDIGDRLPSRLRKRARRSVADFDAIRDALLGVDHRPGLASALRGTTRRVTLTVTELRAGTAETVMTIDGERRADASGLDVPANVRLASARSELQLSELGRRMGRFLFADPVGAGLETVVEEPGTTAELCIEASPGVLIELPFEAALLDSGNAPALAPGVCFWRRMAGVSAAAPPPAPGPLKVLVAVGAPDEGQTPNVPLDVEAEMGSILDAVTEAVRDDRAQVRFLEIANVGAIRDALTADDYHVLHLSGHGGPGTIELEDEDGQAEQLSAAELIDAFRATGKTVSLVFVSSCHSGGETTSLAADLHRGGVARVVAMQAPVTDGYATDLARIFYRVLSTASAPRAGLALATARQEVESARARADGYSLPPEWATPSLLLTGDDVPIIDSDLEQVALRRRPVYALAGPVPALGWGELVGRRRELRVTLRALREDPRFTAAHGTVGGVVLTGTGGVGKSSVAGRVGTRLSEDGWVCSATQGAWSLDAIYQALSFDLAEAGSPWAAPLREQLASVPQDDALRLAGLERALRRHPVLLILDNFEDNLSPDGGAFLDPTTGAVLSDLLNACAVGKLLITSRYPLPPVDAAVHHESIGPLSPGETRRLFLRLEGLKRLERDDVALVGSLIGGHPRVLEFLDALLRQGASVDRVRPKLLQLARDEHVELRGERDLPTAIRDAARLGAADIFLNELLKTLDESEREVLLQTAVSSLPVPLDDLAETLKDIGIAHEATRRAAERLTALSLLVPVDDDIWAHRWTAEALRAHQTDADYRVRCERAGDLRMRRVNAAARDVTEGIEATENYLAAGALDHAAAVGVGVAGALARGSTLRMLSFVSEVRRALPASHSQYVRFADYEGQALMVLGFTGDALDRYREVVQLNERRAAAEPDRPDLRSDLAVSYSRFGDVMHALGDIDRETDEYRKSYEIRRKLAEENPGELLYQRSLMVACERLGSAMVALGEGPRARELFGEGIEIARTLMEAEPNVQEHRRDMAIALNKLGETTLALGDTEQARHLYEQGLEISEQLAAESPNTADYLRDLRVSCDRLASLLRRLGEDEEAEALLSRGLGITQQLRRREPHRADYQRDEAVAYQKLGDLAMARDDVERAHGLYTDALVVTERLAAQDPGRMDLLRDRALLRGRLGDAAAMRGESDEAFELHQEALGIFIEIVAREPDRTDFKFDLAVSLRAAGDTIAAFGSLDGVRELFAQSLAIAEQLIAREPTRADYHGFRASLQERLSVLDEHGRS